MQLTNSNGGMGLVGRPPAQLPAPLFTRIVRTDGTTGFVTIPHVSLNYWGVRQDGQSGVVAIPTAGSATLQAATGTFTSLDVGKLIAVATAGAGGDYLVSTISSVIPGSPNDQVVIADQAVYGNGTTKLATYWGTDNTAMLQSAADNIQIGILELGPGDVCFRGPLDYNGTDPKSWYRAIGIFGVGAGHGPWGGATNHAGGLGATRLVNFSQDEAILRSISNYAPIHGGNFTIKQLRDSTVPGVAAMFFSNWYGNGGFENVYVEGSSNSFLDTWTGTFSSSSTLVTGLGTHFGLTSGRSTLKVGDQLHGPSVRPGTTITAIDPANGQITMSQNGTASGSAAFWSVSLKSGHGLWVDNMAEGGQKFERFKISGFTSPGVTTAVNGAGQTLSTSSGTLTVDSTAGQPTSGQLIIDGVGGVVTYTGTTGTTYTGVKTLAGSFTAVDGGRVMNLANAGSGLKLGAMISSKAGITGTTTIGSKVITGINDFTGWYPGAIVHSVESGDSSLVNAQVLRVNRAAATATLDTAAAGPVTGAISMTLNAVGVNSGNVKFDTFQITDCVVGVNGQGTTGAGGLTNGCQFDTFKVTNQASRMPHVGATYEVDHISIGAASAGTFTYTFAWYGSTYTTPAIAFNASMTALQTALNAATTSGGTALPANSWGLPTGSLATTAVLTAQNALAGPITAQAINSGGLTGATVVVGQTTAGVTRNGNLATLGVLLQVAHMQHSFHSLHIEDPWFGVALMGATGIKFDATLLSSGTFGTSGSGRTGLSLGNTANSNAFKGLFLGGANAGFGWDYGIVGGASSFANRATVYWNTFAALTQSYLRGGANTIVDARTPNWEIGYDAITSNVTINSTSAISVIPGSSYYFDGSPVLIRFDAAVIAPAGTGITFQLYFDGVGIGVQGAGATASTADLHTTVSLLWRATPPEGFHTYSIQAFNPAGGQSGSIVAGAGGMSTQVPATLSIVRAN